MAKLLTICHYGLVPIQGGGALKSFHLLRQLARFHEVHAIIFQRETELRRETEGYKVPDCVRIYSPLDEPPPPSVFDRLPRRLGPGLHYRWLRRSWRGPASGDYLQCHHLVRRILREQEIDAAVFEYVGSLSIAPLIQELSPKTLRILNAHNVDHKLLAQEFRSRESPGHTEESPTCTAPGTAASSPSPLQQERGPGRGVPQCCQSHDTGSKSPTPRPASRGEGGRRPGEGNPIEAGGGEPKVVKQTRLIEQNLGRYVDAVWACSEVDRHDLAAPNGIPGYVIPNGVDTSFYSYDASAQKAEAPFLLFSGWLGTRANDDGVRFLVHEVWPLILKQFPAMRLLIVGGGASEDLKQVMQEIPQIEVSGQVTDVRPYFKRAAVALVPLRIGSGTRLKILEAMSQGNPVVSTRKGAEGIEAQDGEHILLADEPATFAQAVMRLLADRTLFNQMRQRARKFVEDRYDWDVVGEAANQSLCELLREPRAQ
ncbi:MAG: glycosyltransferase [Verrucomicrobia bacterium]|nr:glycosyltransferase [Verrucomicrobiota bacterium]